MNLTNLLKNWRSAPSLSQNIAVWRTFPACQAQTAPLPADLHATLTQALRSQGIESLYTHQAAAWEQTQAGQHPVIVTGTASGKTLCYNLPVLHHLLTDPHSRALYLFPTKALAHDQLSIINYQFSASTYDGDTSPSLRPAIRGNARIILSNPDMLHTAILPHHTKWAEFFRHLHFVVIDEMHVYRGVFGSHVANVLRRLKRVANFYGATLQFILTSATIANPVELAERLIEEQVTLINNDGAAKGAKHFLIYNPPVVNAELGVRRSALQESARLGRELIEAGTQTIIFGRTRRTVELLLTYLREGVAQASSIRAYRSGYLPHQRREIERGLREGAVQAVVATSALELGLDIGTMSVALLVGYPGTIAGTWQQAGRAGRTQEEALAMLITSANPLDQFLAHHPDYFFDRSPEQALINPDNLLILLQHLRCAAFELPFQSGDAFGHVEAGQVAEFLRFLSDGGELHQSGQKYFWMAEHYPAEKVSLRSASPASVRLQVRDDNESWRTIGQVDIASAFWMVHPQAIYLHEGQSFIVEELDLDGLVARLRPSQVDHYTEPTRDTTVQLIEQLNHAQIKGGSKHHGEILVTTQIVGYRLVQWFTQEHLGDGEVDLPPQELTTTGYWLTLAPATVDQLRAQGLWSNDPNNYGPTWAAQRNRARARDGYRCQICGAPEQGREHDVHHRIPFRRFDTYQQANQLSNLATLCRPCHRRAETAVKMRSGLTGLATVLGHLAPLFLMCDTYDIGLHADSQSPMAEGQPAVIIYDAIPAGVGFSRRLFELHDTLIKHAYDLVAGCPCAAGCPSCIGPAGEEGVGGKREALALLSALR
jgi:DEAD/DEAH box helicase domain-containing protein